MPNNLFRYFLLVVAITFCCVSCSKHTEDINPATHFTFTPSEWSTWLGKDWTTITPNLKNMTGFSIKHFVDTETTTYTNEQLIKIPLYDINEPIRNLWISLSCDSANKIQAMRLWTDSSMSPILTKNKNIAYDFTYYNLNQIFSLNSSVGQYAKFQYGTSSIVDGTPTVTMYTASDSVCVNILKAKQISLNQMTAYAQIPTLPSSSSNLYTVGLAYVNDSIYNLEVVIEGVPQ